MTTFRFFIALFVLFESSIAQKSVGTVVGTVTDLDTHEVLIGVNVVLKTPEGKDLLYGAATDISG